MTDRHGSTDADSTGPLPARASAAYLEIARAYIAPPGTPHAAPHVYERPGDAAGLRAPAYETAGHPVVAAYSAGSALPPAYEQSPLPPGYAPTTPALPGAQPDRRPRGLARWALALTIIGGLLQVIPFGRGFGRFLLFVAIVLAIITLMRRRSGGKGIATAAIALSAFAWVLSLVIGLVSGFFPASPDPGAVDPGAVAGPGPVYSPQSDILPLTENAIGTDDGGATWFAGIIDLPEAYVGSRFLDVYVIALDSGGRILDRTPEYYAFPASRLGVASTYFDLSEPVASVVVEVAESSSTSGDTGAPVLTAEVTGTEAETSRTTVTGTVRSTSPEPSTYVQVVVIARAPDGSIIGGADGWAEQVPADGEAGTFSATFYTTLPSDTVFELYPTLG